MGDGPEGDCGSVGGSGWLAGRLREAAGQCGSGGCLGGCLQSPHGHFWEDRIQV